MWLMRTVNLRWPQISRRTVTRSLERQAVECTKAAERLLGAIETDVSFTADCWSAEGNHYIMVTTHWVDDAWNLNTKILGTHSFPPPHTAKNVSDVMMELRLKFGRPPKTSVKRARCGSDREWFRHEEPFDRPVITTDLGSDISAGVEKDGLWDWSRCILHVLHLSVCKAMETVETALEQLKELGERMHRSGVAWQRFVQTQKIVHKAKVDAGVAMPEGGSARATSSSNPVETMADCCDSEVEEEEVIIETPEEAEMSSLMPDADQGTRKGEWCKVWRLVRPVPTRWNTWFACLERALKLKQSIQMFLRTYPFSVGTSGTDKMVITDHTWCTYAELLEVTRPLKDFSMKCEGDECTSVDVLRIAMALLYTKLKLDEVDRIQRPARYDFIVAWQTKFLVLMDDVEQFFYGRCVWHATVDKKI